MLETIDLLNHIHVTRHIVSSSETKQHFLLFSCTGIKIANLYQKSIMWKKQMYKICET